MMKRCAVAGFCLGGVVLDVMRRVGNLHQRGGEASVPPAIWAPILSAEYSRVRLIAICTSMAANGAKITIAIVPIRPTLVVAMAAAKNRPTAPAWRLPAMVA